MKKEDILTIDCVVDLLRFEDREELIKLIREGRLPRPR